MERPAPVLAFDDPGEPRLEAKLAGIFAPICTPFAANEDVGHGALRFNVARFAETGILGYLALGSNGENRSLAEDEKLRVLDEFLRDPDPDAREAALPDYVPYLGGSRYSLELLKGQPAGLTLETTREDLLLGLIRGNAAYLGGHLREVAELVPIGRRVGISGGGSRIRGMLEARRRWTGDFDDDFQDQSSLLGAAILGQISQSGGLRDPGQLQTRVIEEAIS